MIKYLEDWVNVVFMGGEKGKFGEYTAFEVLIEEWLRFPVITFEYLGEFKKMLHEFISN